MVQVVHVKRRNGAKPMIDLTKKAPKAPIIKPEIVDVKEPKRPAQVIGRACNGPPIAADLEEKLRGKSDTPNHLPLSDEQIEALKRVLQNVGEGHPETLGLRLVLAASEDEYAAKWGIGGLARGLRVYGHVRAGKAVARVALGCRVARFKDMAAKSLEIVSQKLEEKQKAKPKAETDLP